MLTHRAHESLPPYLIDRSLLRAWREMGCGDLDVARVEVLHRKKKSTVYRVIGARDGRPTLIAKRCRASVAGLERLVYQELLVGLPVPSLRCLGCVPEADG